MRTSTPLHLPPRVRRGATLATLCLIIASGLTGCSQAGPTEPTLDVSMDPGRLGGQTAIPLEWLTPTAGGTTVTVHPLARRVQHKPDALHYVR